MKLTEKNYRSLFKAGVIMKGIIAIGEVIVGLLFAFVSYATLIGVATSFTGDELTERPLDPFWGYVVSGFHGFTATPQAVWSFIFLSHGIVKLFFIAALLKNKAWAYPWSAVVFSGFIVYQIWQMAYTPSLVLLLVTLLDLIVVGLVIHEYRWRKRHGDFGTQSS